MKYVLVLAIINVIFTPLGFLMLIFISKKTGTWYTKNQNPQSPSVKNRRDVVEIIRIKAEVPPVLESPTACRSESVRVIEVERMSSQSYSYQASTSTKNSRDYSEISIQNDITDQGIDLKWQNQVNTSVVTAHWLSPARLSCTLNEFASTEYTSNQFRSISYAARKGYPYFLLVAIGIVSSTIDVFCVIGLDVSNQTLVLLPFVITFWNLGCIVSLSCNAVSHYLFTFITVVLDMAMAISTTIDLWASSSWLQRTVMTTVQILMVILIPLMAKSFAFEWIFILLCAIWSAIFVIFRFS